MLDNVEKQNKSDTENLTKIYSDNLAGLKSTYERDTKVMSGHYNECRMNAEISWWSTKSE